MRIFSRGSSWPRDQLCISCGSYIAGEFFTAESLREAPLNIYMGKPNPQCDGVRRWTRRSIVRWTRGRTGPECRGKWIRPVCLSWDVYPPLPSDVCAPSSWALRLRLGLHPLLSGVSCLQSTNCGTSQFCHHLSQFHEINLPSCLYSLCPPRNRTFWRRLPSSSLPPP